MYGNRSLTRVKLVVDNVSLIYKKHLVCIFHKGVKTIFALLHDEPHVFAVKSGATSESEVTMVSIGQ
jgi:hypothetical protein